MLGSLYSTDILKLSSTLQNAALTPADGTARKVSKLCGSAVEIDVNLTDGRVSEVALRVQACALGQASAAILQQHIVGASLADVTAARDALRNMLKGEGAPPQGRFKSLRLLEGVKAYPARHQSTLLAFEAAVEAIDMALADA
jgi:NifU-like protein involved in Fe-S cluster formation